MLVDEYTQPDFEERQRNRTRDLFTFVLHKLYSQASSMNTSSDEKEYQELQAKLLLSLSAIVSLLTAYIIDDEELTESVKDLLR